ncbi:MAG: Ava_C0101 and related proteins, partial [uncultured Solirubrobacteraceae bacterium]
DPDRLAAPAVRRVGADEADRAPVHADHRQGPDGAGPAAEPLVARHAPARHARAHDRADALRRSLRRDPARPPRPPAPRDEHRRALAHHRADAPARLRRRVPRGVRRARRVGRRGRDPRRAVRPGRQPAVRAGPRQRRVRHRRGHAVLARPRVDRPRPRAVPQRLRRQGEPGAPVLALVRPRPRPLLRASGAGRTGRRPGQRRGVLPRGHRVRVLARRRSPHAVPGLLLLHRPGARGPRRPAARADGGRLAGHRLGFARGPAVRRGARVGRPGGDAPRLLRERLRGRRAERGLGPRAADAHPAGRAARPRM